VTRRLSILAVAIAALALPSPAAATTIEAPSLAPIEPGGLWRGGQLYRATMRAQVGSPTIATVGRIRLTAGTGVVNDVDIAYYECRRPSRSTPPSSRSGCVADGSVDVKVGQRVAYTPEQRDLGRHLAVEQVVRIIQNGSPRIVRRWTEALVFPASARADGPARIVGTPRMGGEVTVEPRPWRLGAGTRTRVYATEAYVCPTAATDRDDRPLRDLGCTRILFEERSGLQPDVVAVPARAGGRPTQNRHLVAVSWIGVTAPGFTQIQYRIRSKAVRIQGLPRPEPVLSDRDGVITATMDAIAGGRYVVTATLGDTRKTARCATRDGATTCTVAVDPGTWTVRVVAQVGGARSPAAVARLVVD